MTNTDYEIEEPKYNCAYTDLLGIERLVENPRNPNQHTDKQIEVLAKIINYQGQRSPIVISKRSGFITKGHGRLAEIKILGWEKAAVDFQDYENDAQEYADMVADNQIAELSKSDEQMILADMKDFQIEDFDLLGMPDFEPVDVGSQGNTDKDAVPDVPEPITKKGDVWMLGPHRLVCGDSTAIDDVEKAVNGKKVDLLLTDPPYNVAYQGKTKDSITIENDSMGDSDFRQFLSDVFVNADTVMKKGAVFYIWHADSEGYNFRGACQDAGWKVRQCLIWNKNSMVMGRQDYHWKHEPCLYGWKDGDSHLWASDRKQVTILEFDRPVRNDVHPTMKPVDLIEYQIQNNTKGEDIVLDLFLGSGSTMIAAESTGRVCYGLELDPRYCDVIVKRWEEFTGKEAVLEETMQTYQELKTERLPG